MDCKKCFYESRGSGNFEWFEYDSEDPIIFYDADEFENGQREVEVHYDQSKIGYAQNELYETRIESEDLRIQIPKNWVFTGMPFSSHSDYIAKKVIRKLVVNAPNDREENIFIFELIGKWPMKLDDNYFELPVEKR